jgi:mannose/cellobiose epimerase-like protein (N-acyl-D-glucosamine 2-epimerase family)
MPMQNITIIVIRIVIMETNTTVTQLFTIMAIATTITTGTHDVQHLLAQALELINQT